MPTRALHAHIQKDKTAELFFIHLMQEGVLNVNIILKLAFLVCLQSKASNITNHDKEVA